MIQRDARALSILCCQVWTDFRSSSARPCAANEREAAQADGAAATTNRFGCRGHDKSTRPPCAASGGMVDPRAVEFRGAVGHFRMMLLLHTLLLCLGGKRK